MPTLLIEDFKLGIDARNMNESIKPGAVIQGDNCVINQGGELEKHEAWRKAFKLPTGNTHGMRVVDDITFVFGSVANPGTMPQKVEYIQLTPASGGTMTQVLHTTLFAGLIYVIAVYDTGKIVHFYDTDEVVALPDKSAVGSFVLSGTGGEVNQIRVDSVDLVLGNIPFNTDVTQTAKDVRDAINTNPTIPNYRATSLAGRVIISASAPGIVANGKVLTALATGMVVAVDIATLAGGTVHTAQTEFQPGAYAFTAESKMNVLSSTQLIGSHLNDPLDYDQSAADPTATPPTSAAAGEFIINMASHESATDTLRAMAPYFKNYAILSRNSIQIWDLDPDPDLQAKVQIIPNSGTVSAGSVLGFGNDTAFLGRTGIRSLRGRDSSNLASVNDIGTAIDPIIQELVLNEKIATRTSLAVLDPLTDRYYLAIGEEAYIFNYFPGNKISGWTKTNIGFKVDVFDQRELRIIVRSGDTVYQLGGSQSGTGVCSETQYGDRNFPDGDGLGLNSQADIITPFFDSSDASRFKYESGVDVTCEGKWEVYILQHPADLTKQRHVCTIDGSTHRMNKIPLIGKATHTAFRFVSVGHEFAKISRIQKHYTTGEKG